MLRRLYGLSLGISVLVVFSFGARADVSSSDGKYDDLILRAENSIKAFQEALKSELVKAMEEGGPEQAISVCHEKSPAIAKAVSEADGVSVGRTSTKVRNQDNLPDEWESGVLADFEHQISEGKKAPELVAYEVQDNQFRYMKAITTQPLCMTCHGDQVDPDLYAKIKQTYPQDKAIGYKIDDLRGAFTVSIPLSDAAAGM